MCKPPWMQILLLYYIWIWKCKAHFSIGVQIDQSNKNFSNDSDDKNKKQTNKTQLASKQIHLCILYYRWYLKSP